jgi:hypothetical protein
MIFHQQPRCIRCLILAVLLIGSCSGGPVDNFHEFPSAFRERYVTMSASPNRVRTDTVISIRMTAFPLLSGKGTMILTGHTNTNSWWSMVSPYNLPAIYDTATDYRILYDTSFTANEAFVMEWRVKLPSATSRYNFRGTLAVDSLFIPDSGRYTPLYPYKDGARYESTVSCRGSCLVLQP